MRRLITLISAGRNRTIVIRRELPRTKTRELGARPYRIKRSEGSPFREPSPATGAASELSQENDCSWFCRQACCLLDCGSVLTAMPR